VADTMGMSISACVLAVGTVYVVTLAAMSASGWRIAATYLAIPAWYVVSAPFFALASEVPGMVDLLGWQTWNTLLIVLSGSLNVSAAYWAARALRRRTAHELHR
jgi:hypothetical protein